jgi:hypothetical protein
MTWSGGNAWAAHDEPTFVLSLLASLISCRAKGVEGRIHIPSK